MIVSIFDIIVSHRTLSFSARTLLDFLLPIHGLPPSGIFDDRVTFGNN